MLAAAREELRLQLVAAGMTVYDYIPERITPPVAVIEPGGTYVAGGQTFCEFEVGMQVVLLASTATNEVATSELDQYICDVLDQVDTFDLVAVAQPSGFEVSNATYLGTRISFTVNKDLTT
jgi:hypothetical protein